jgi:hypothetical protein
MHLLIKSFQVGSRKIFIKVSDFAIEGGNRQKAHKIEKLLSSR